MTEVRRGWEQAAVLGLEQRPDLARRQLLAPGAGRRWLRLSALLIGVLVFNLPWLLLSRFLVLLLD